ncbi:MAG: protease complex subunit PrcB family protein, partial [Bacillota bacterium]
NAFGQLVTANGQQQLALVAALGERNTGGYAINILWVEKAEHKLIVHAKETKPTPGAAVIQAITYPYQAVVIDQIYKDWAVELDLVQTVDFVHADWVTVNSYESAEQGVVKTLGKDGKLLLTVCAGEKPNPGYGLRVERIEQENQRLIVHARVSEPAPGTIWAQVISYPRDVVALAGAYSDYAVQLVLH